jgi:hypothetical protein
MTTGMADAQMSIEHQPVCVMATKGSAPLIVASAAMTALVEATDRAARPEGKVLITGESGVGKDLIARRIHGLSRRAGRPFVPVNCAGLAESLLESELFGHAKGSFTGAYRDQLGKLQAAQGGTVFLDEVGEMSLRMQALLLRFLENGEIQSVGSDTRPETVNVRVVAATNRNLADLIAAGQIREDLLYRLRVTHLEVPPLRRRKRGDSRARRLLRVTNASSRQLHRRCDAGALALPVAGERARAPERRGASDVAHARRDDRPCTSSEVLRMPPQPIHPNRERRVQVADELYAALVNGGSSFWDHCGREADGVSRLEIAIRMSRSLVLLSAVGIPSTGSTGAISGLIY